MMVPALVDVSRHLAATGVRAVLFDVDGTLYTQPVLRMVMAGELAAATCMAPRRMRVTVRTLSAFRRIREHLRALGQTQVALEDLQYARTAEQVAVGADLVRAAVNEWMFNRPLRHMKHVVRPGLREMLADLAGRGIQIGALSDYPTDAKLDALGVRRYFSVGLCTTDRSINAFKPHPKGFQVACKYWGLAPQEVVYVGDRPEIDAAGAAAAGLRCIIIGRSRRPADQHPRHATIRHFADLPRHLVAP